MLMLPWAIAGRFAAIWIIWILLINLAVVLYYQVFGGLFDFVFGYETQVIWIVFFFNTVAQGVWESLATVRKWLVSRWAIRLLAFVSGFALTWIVLYDIIDKDNQSLISGFVWMVWMIGIYFIYRKLVRDLFMLAGACLSGIVIATIFLGKHLVEFGKEGTFLLLTLLVIGMGAGAAYWLRSVHREWQT